ncbi:class I SAM-dependent methyltransferase [Natronosalvus rutilus]|uniref:Class I SAM-dependent methyltransferase n=1 Tax=Natronosalvus rutilus TaxID=2953753 RepID=A0A9E7NC94_9EURY|nr:class I SAM-dependent methyltransferase [Natronosalvus rutilus]UTF54243.1 class I SAM-dependent methyltransferase [Natronosalvus rutilus]
MSEDHVARTLQTYESDADAYVEKYRTESVLAQYGEAFLEALENADGKRVLDVGCGPGVDSAAFEARGYDAIGLDLTESFLQAATKDVPSASFLRGDMRALPVATDAVDGLWACASFLHVPRTDAPATLHEFRRVLDADGVLYLSVKRPDLAARDESNRYFEPYQPRAVRDLLEAAGFERVTVTELDGWVSALARTPAR